MKKIFSILLLAVCAIAIATINYAWPARSTTNEAPRSTIFTRPADTPPLSANPFGLDHSARAFDTHHPNNQVQTQHLPSFDGLFQNRPCPHVYEPVCCYWNKDESTKYTQSSVCVCEKTRGQVLSTGDCPEAASRATVGGVLVQTVENVDSQTQHLPSFDGLFQNRPCPHVYEPVCCYWNKDESTKYTQSSVCVCEKTRGQVLSTGDCPEAASRAAAVSIENVAAQSRIATGSPYGFASKSTAERLPLAPQLPPSAVKLPSDFGNLFGRRCPPEWQPVCCLPSSAGGVHPSPFTMHSECGCKVIHGTVIANMPCEERTTSRWSSKSKSKLRCRGVKECLSKIFSS